MGSFFAYLGFGNGVDDGGFVDELCFWVLLLGNDGRMGNAMGVFLWNGIFLVGGCGVRCDFFFLGSYASDLDRDPGVLEPWCWKNESAIAGWNIL